MVDQADGSGFTSVSGILLECETEDGDTFTGDGVEESVDDLFSESILLVLVHLDDGVPVLGDGREMEGFGEVDEVENIL